MTNPPEYTAYHAPDESPDYPYQARWYTGTTYHADGYERGGWYASEQEAIDGAKLGMAIHRAMGGKQYIRMYNNGDGRGLQYHTDAEIVAYLQAYPDDVEGWIDSVERLAKTHRLLGDMRGLRENYNHIADVVTALKKANGEDILE